MLAADYPFLDILWTMFIFFLWIAWLLILFRIFGDIFRRNDISGWGKAAWVIFVIILPFLGTLIYLVVNARDAMPNGGKLTIETGTVTLGEAFSAQQLGVPPGQYVTLSISDTGVGMDEATKSHMFEPFFTTKRPGRGLGLGLFLVRTFVERAGGTLEFNATEGTTAIMELPALAQEASLT